MTSLTDGRNSHISEVNCSTALVGVNAPVPATKFSPNGPNWPPVLRNWHSEAHVAAFAAKSSDHETGAASCAARTVLWPARYSAISAGPVVGLGAGKSGPGSAGEPIWKEEAGGEGTLDGAAVGVADEVVGAGDGGAFTDDGDGLADEGGRLAIVCAGGLFLENGDGEGTTGELGTVIATDEGEGELDGADDGLSGMTDLKDGLGGSDDGAETGVEGAAPPSVTGLGSLVGVGALKVGLVGG